MFAMTTESENNERVNGDVCLRKQRRKRQKFLITGLLLDYARNSTLHGLRYVAEKGLTTIEKLFWILTFAGSIILCSLLIKNVYIKWRTSPIIVTVSERLVSVGEVPFPSVTICPQIKSKATVYDYSAQLDQFNKNTTEISDEDKAKLADITLLCDGMEEDIVTGDRLYTNASLIDNINSVAPKLSEQFLFCGWRNHSHDVCDKLFKKVLTAEGLCYNMNALAADEIFRDTVQTDYKYSERNSPTRGWSLEDGYTGTEDNPFPLQGSENGANPDLEVYLVNEDVDYDALCNGVNSGFKIYIQHPSDHPQSSLFYYAAPDSQVSSMAISVDIINSALSLEEYPAEIRQCYFQEDRMLRYFKIYSASNCRAECLSNYTYEKCGCVGYYMPHDNSSQICAERNINCMAKAQNDLAKREFQLKISKSNGGCDCLVPCNSVEYNAEIIRTDFHYKRYAKNLAKFYNESSNEYYNITARHSKIEMYFKKPQFVSMRRSELFGLTDFLANIGGLLGLFLGFSFLSLMELCYFVTLRLGCTLKRDLKDETIRIGKENVRKNQIQKSF